MRRRKKYEVNLDEEDFIVSFTDREGRKRKFRLVTSEGYIEYRGPRGEKLLRIMLEEVEEEGGS